jgi:hypothetical protein
MLEEDTMPDLMTVSFSIRATVQHRTTDELSISVYSTQRTGPLAHFRCSLTFYARESQIDVTMADNTDGIEPENEHKPAITTELSTS